MIIYKGTIKEFKQSVAMGEIADKIDDLFKKNRIPNNDSQYRAFQNSLTHMYMVLNDREISEELEVAIEYQIPSTSKRVDFIVTGRDSINKEKGIIIELKQWEKAQHTSKADVVTTYVGGGIRPVAHPSYQAYSYAKTIENYCSYVYDNEIELLPCSYLHNYKDKYREEIDNDFYRAIIDLSPMFLKRDVERLRDFIKSNITKSDKGSLLYGIENGKIKPSKALQDALYSMFIGNKEFYMIDEQKVAYSTILNLIDLSFENKQKSTIIIEGGPGTGKSVIALSLLVELRDKLVYYATKNAAPKEVFKKRLLQGDYKKSYIEALFKSTGSFIDVPKNSFDCLLVDEAHRANEKTGLFSKGYNQIYEIIDASWVSVFFIDEDQIVTIKDFGTIEEIKRCATILNSHIYSGDDYKLTSQFRCNGSDGYISFLDDVLAIRETANYNSFDLGYDIKIYDSPTVMKEDLRVKNNIKNKARILAGYCYEWVSKNNPDGDVYDITLEEGFKAKWNLSNTKTFAIDENSFEQVGCIHTAQGIEFDYVGVIIGKDLRYENDKVITDHTKRAKTDKSLSGMKKHNLYDKADRIIRNTYRTLLTRGQKGCYIYCEDKALSKYLKERLLNR